VRKIWRQILLPNATPKRYADGGEDAKLKAWAAKALPALQHHLEMAEALNKQTATN
jgi:predicted outer membrane protein